MLLGRSIINLRSSSGAKKSFQQLVVQLQSYPSRSFAAAGRVRVVRREAPLPALTNPVENAINAAQRRGDLNNLSGSGKPLKQEIKDFSSKIPTGLTSSELLSKKAEFEMRRSIHNKELEHLQGQKMEYKGTSIVGSSSSIGGGGESGSGGGGGGSGDAMSRYILEQAQPTAQDLKSS